MFNSKKNYASSISIWYVTKSTKLPLTVKERKIKYIVCLHNKKATSKEEAQQD